MSRRPLHRWLGCALVALSFAPIHNLQENAAAAAPAATGANPAAAAKSPLGRLFYTPERREALDRQRASNRPAEKQVESRQLSFDGLVQRSSGRRTVWVNGRPLTERDDSILIVRPNPDRPGHARLTIPNEGGHDMQVGSAVNRETGEIRTPLGDGRIRRSAAP